MAFLVSDQSHKPVAVFDRAEEAIGYICSWHNVSVRFTELRNIPHTTISEVRYNKDTLGFVIDGIEHNPKYIHRS